jgi:hypothetical protein
MGLELDGEHNRTIMTASRQQPQAARRRLPPISPLGVIGAVAGLALFVYFVRRVGTAEVLDGARRVGWGFGVVLLLAGVRLGARALGWIACVEPPHVLPRREAFAAMLVGEAVGNITPLGLIASEPAKAAFVRRRVPLSPALSALAIENLFYTLSVFVVIAGGMMALLAGFRLPPPLRTASLVAMVAVLMAIAAMCVTLWRRHALLSRVLRWTLPRGLRTTPIVRWLDRLERVEERVYGFYHRRGDRLARLLLLEGAFHAAGVAEVFVILWFMTGAPPPLLTAFVLESVNRVINVIFRFVPLRLGVDEAGTGLFTAALGFGAATGVALAIVRKGRVLFWTAIGVTLLVKRGLSFGERPTDD